VGRTRWRSEPAITGCLLVSVALVAGETTFAADPFPGGLPGTDISHKLGAYEPSGLAWHSRLQALFVVDDGGTLTMLDRNGLVLDSFAVPGDLEGVTVADPVTDFIYIAIESPGKVVEFDLAAGVATRTFVLIDPLPPPAGLEALTFVPDPGHPEGGLFYAGIQADGSVHVFELPIKSSSTSTTATEVDAFFPVPGRADLSGLHYDPRADVIYGIYDGANRFIAMTVDGTLLNDWVLPGGNQEGITTANCELFVAEEIPRIIWRYDFPLNPDDSDLDGVFDCADTCPDDFNTDQQDTDGDGVGDVCDADDDGDGVEDPLDNCPMVFNPEQTDTDDDGLGNACDTDDDDDGVDDLLDNCPLVFNPLQENSDQDGMGNACDPDDDNDNIDDPFDNCPLVANPDQTDTDGDGMGDACDPDDDDDGWPDTEDNCPLVENAGQADDDEDGLGNACDDCPADPDNDVDGDLICGDVDNCPETPNPDQIDTDEDGMGDACDPDDDDDGRLDGDDNCPLTANPLQNDQDDDGVGDLCDCAPTDGSATVDPVEVTDLRLISDRVDETVELVWDAQLAHYDVATASVEEPWSPATILDAQCLVDDLVEAKIKDRLIDVEFAVYVVRAQNACGTGTYGSATNGDERVTEEACP